MAIEYIEYGDNGRVARDIINNMLSEVESHIPSIGENGHWYIGGVDTGITARGVELRVLNNLMKVNEEQKTYVDLQMASGITPEDDLEVGVTVGRISSVDGWNQSGIMLNWQTTAGEYVRLISGDDGKIYLDGGDGTWQQIYNKSDIDGLFQTLRNELSSVAFSGDFNDLQNKPTIGDATLTIQKNGTAIDTFTANATVNKAINITVPTATSDIDNDSGFIDKTVDNLDNYTKTSDLASVATSGDYEDLINTPSLSTVATSGSYDDLTDKPTIGTATLTIQKNGTKIDDFSANATSNKTINVTVPTKTSDISNDSGYITKAVADLDNYTPTSSLGAVALSNDYTDLDNKPTIPTNVSDLNNDSGFIDKDVDDLTNYTKTSDLPTVGTATITVQKNGTKVDDFSVNATSNKNINITMSKTDVGLGNVDNTSDANKPISTATQTALNAKQDTIIAGNNITINNDGKTINAVNTTYTAGANIQIDGNNEISATDTTYTAGTNVQISNSNVISATDTTYVASDFDIKDLSDSTGLRTTWSGKQNTIVAGTNIQIASDGVTISATDTVTPVVDNLTSTSTTSALSANQGRILDAKIADLQAMGKFLSLWDGETGLPISFPHQTPYTYSTGDYYLVENVDATTNYRPDGSSYTGTASTVVETDELEIGDMYIYDGNVWLLQINHGKTVSFANLSGEPTDNTALANALGDKADVSSLATVATSGDYDDLLNKPTIPSAQIQSDWTQADNTKKDYIKNKPTLSAVATSGSYNDLSNKPTIPTVNNATITIQKNGTKVDDFTANQSSAKTINITVPTKTSDITNDSGFITSANIPTKTSDLTNDSGYITSASIPTATSDLTNDSGYITSSDIPTNVSAFTNDSGYITSASLPTVNNKKITIQKNGTKVDDFTLNQSTDKTINIVVPTKTSDITNDSGFITKSVNDLTNYTLSTALSEVATSGAYSDLIGTPTIPADTSDLTNGAGFITASDLSNGSGISISGTTISNSGVLSVNGNTGAVTVSEFAPGTGTTGQVVTKTATGYAYASIPSQVSDTAYASSWNGVTGTAPSKNAVYDKISAMDTTIAGKADSSSLATVATTGAYSDLTGTPTIPTVNNATLTVTQNGTSKGTFTANASSNVTIEVKDTTYESKTASSGGTAVSLVTTGEKYTWNNKQDTISDLATIRSGASAGATAVQPGDLATVATTGAYSDLTGKPTIPTVNNATLTIQKNGTTVKTFTANASSNVTANITVPTKVSDLTNDSGYITKSVSDLTNYTPTTSLATVATSGSYNDLSNKPTIPSVNNSTITFTQNGISKGDITLNQSSNETIALTDTTYSNITKSEIQYGTATTQRTISASVIKESLPTISGESNNILGYAKIRAGNKSDYDAMNSHDANTLYFCIDDGWKPGSNTLVYLPLNGDANDTSGNGNNGTLYTNNGSYSRQYINGSSGAKCFYSELSTSVPSGTDKSGGEIRGTYSSTALGTGTRTVSIWHKTTGQNTTGSIHWLGSQNGGTQGEWFGLYHSSTQFGILRYYNDPYITKSSWDTSWHNYVITYDSTNKSKLYIDGVLQTFAGNGTQTFNTLGTGYQIGTLRVNGSSSSTNYYMADFIVENVVWSASEVSDYYNQTKSKYGL